MSANSTAADSVAMLGETPLGGGWMGSAPESGYRLRITTGSGDRETISGLTSLSVNRRHTAMSDWSATVPHRVGIDDRVLSSIRLEWGDTILFRGRLEDVGGEIGAPVVDISGRGIEADLTRGDVTLNLGNVRRCDAIEQVWTQHTDFSPTVIVPDDDTHPACGRITTDPDDEEYSGTPMDVLQTLHGDAGMRFTVLHSRPGLHVESYPAGGRRRRHNWDVLGGDRDVSAKEYANRVVVKGEFHSDGTRLTAVAEDDQEIEAMRQRGIGDDGHVTYPVSDRTLTDPAEAEDIAQSELADLVDKDSVGGSLDVSPTVAAPGFDYYVPEFGGPEPEPYGTGVYGAGTYGTKPGQYVSLEKINYSISRGDVSCTLDFSRREGFAETLEKAYGAQR